MIAIEVPCFHCQIRSDCCHIKCMSYQEYAKKCKERHEKQFKEKETQAAIIDLRIKQKDRLRRRRLK